MVWHYSDESSRKGPVSKDDLSKLVESGKIDGDTLVWKTGMSEWTPLYKCNDLSTLINTQVPPPLAANAMGNGFIWAVALAPIWGSIVQIIATELRVAITGEAFVLYSSMWWVMILCNILTISMDEKKIKKAGYNAEKLKIWMYLIVPVYVYQRDKLLKEGMTRFWVWIGAFILSLFMFEF